MKHLDYIFSFFIVILLASCTTYNCPIYFTNDGSESVILVDMATQNSPQDTSAVVVNPGDTASVGTPTTHPHCFIFDGTQTNNNLLYEFAMIACAKTKEMAHIRMSQIAQGIISASFTLTNHTKEAHGKNTQKAGCSKCAAAKQKKS